MASIEQEIIERIHGLDEQQQLRVLEFLDTIREVTEKSYTALELMKLPFEERSRLVSEAIEASADEDFEIFEAYSEEDFDDYTD